MDGSPSNIDVIIIGAGPAGTATAIWCAKHQLSVMIVENTDFPRHRPGETLHPGISVLFEQLGVKEEIDSKAGFRHNGNSVVSEAGTTFQPFNLQGSNTALGYQILREDLDDILLRRAIALGVQVLQPCKALSVILEYERVIGLCTSRGNIFAKFVIDAAGSAHWLAKQMGLEIKKYSRPLIVRYGYLKGIAENNKFADPVFSFEKDGWVWIAQVRKDLYQWTRLTKDKNRFCNITILPLEHASLKKIGPTRGADATWRRVPDCAGKGYFLVGDASFVFDPSASKGVLKAIYSGIMVGHSVLRLCQHQSNQTTVINGFKRWMEVWFDHDLKIMGAFYAGKNIPIGKD